VGIDGDVSGPAIPPEVVRLAEDSNAYQPLGPDEERIVTDRYVLYLGTVPHPAANAAQRLRLDPANVASTVEEVRSLIHDRGLDAFTWEVSTSATPPDLADRLMAMGIVPFEEPLAVAMVLAATPPPGPSDVQVRTVRTAEEWRIGQAIVVEAFGAELGGEGTEDIAPLAEAELDAGPRRQYLAYLDGEAVATAWATFTEHGVILNGGSTLPRARGRGAYRALVAARWDDAVARGTPALVTQAGAMSRPILRRLGFEEVAEIRILLDHAERAG
jgi:Fe2+ transport system protein FeoA